MNRLHAKGRRFLHFAWLQKIHKRNIQLEEQQTESKNRTKESKSALDKMRELDLEPELNLTFICNSKNASHIKENITRRNSTGDIDQILTANEELKRVESSADASKINCVKDKLLNHCLLIPNRTHPDVFDLKDPKVVAESGQKQNFSFQPRKLEDLCHHWRMIETKHATKFCGTRAYYLKSSLALLEQALIQYTVDKLLAKDFVPVSVPDLIHPGVLEGCGMQTDGNHNQIYTFSTEKHGEVCLAGTAEIALAGMLMKKTLEGESLPLKFAAVSRCYRAEISRSAIESGLFRVHEFTKVEMFAVTNGDEKHSESMLNDIVSLQQNLFSDLGLHYQVVEMPPKELGLPAYHKFDIEAWMPGRKIYGEISSASNCTDFQSRRLGIKCVGSDGETKFAHTVNGTACAVPRMLIAILEQYQDKDFVLRIPPAMWPYTNGLKTIEEKQFPKMAWNPMSESKE